MKYLFGAFCLSTVLLAGASSAMPQESVAQSLVTPPLAVWGKPFEIRLVVSTDVTNESNLTILLSRDDKPDSGDPILFMGKLAGDREIKLNISLPVNLCWQDGDYYLIAAVDGQGAMANSIHAESRDMENAYVPRNYDLVGAQLSPAGFTPDWVRETFIRHARYDVSWRPYEPEQGKWNEEAFEKLGKILLTAKNYDMTILPTLSGCPGWAGKGWGPPNDPAQWAAFVDKIVGTFSKAPYYQQHWQIWNEAETDTGFWHGRDIQEYVDTIHNPAADVIHRHYVDRNGNGKEDAGERCLVVYGGWPCTHHADGEYGKALDYNGCGDRTDILDVHYMSTDVGGLEWFESPLSGQVYQKWVENGDAIGCWQTENGWGFSKNPYWLPELYVRDLHWALNHDWHRSDQYREYFFHYYASQTNHGFSWGNNPKYPNFYSMRTFMITTRGDLYLPKDRQIEVEGGAVHWPLICGGRLVMLLKDYNAGETVVLKVGLRSGEIVSSVSKIDVVYGIETPLDHLVKDGQLVIKVPTSQSELHPKMCYISVICEDKMNP